MTTNQTTYVRNLLQKGELLYANRNLEQASTIVDEAVQLASENQLEEELILSEILLAKIHETGGRYKGEIQDLLKATELLEDASNRLIGKDLPRLSCVILLTSGAVAQTEKRIGYSNDCYDKALAKSKFIENRVFQIKSLIGLSENATIQNRSSVALDYALQAKALLLLENISSLHHAQIYNQLSQIYFKQQDFDKMLDYSQKVLDICSENGDVEKELNALKNIAIYHAANNDYKKAMQFFLAAKEKSNIINYRQHTAQCLINIATIYANLYNREEALDRYHTVLNEFSDVISSNTRIVIYNNLGNINYLLEAYEQAVSFFKKAHDLARNHNYNEMILLSLANLSRTLIAKNEVDEAMVCAEDAAQLMTSQGDVNGKQINLLNLGHIHFLKGNLSGAMLFTSKGIATANRMKDDTNQVHGYSLMSKIYAAQEDYKTALDYQTIYAQAKDKLAKKQRNKQIIDLEIKNAIKEKQKEIEQLTKENEYQGLLLKQSDQIAAQNAQLIAANEELRQFAYITSHDLKEPIRMIGSYTQLIERKHQHQFTEHSKSYFKYVKEGVSRMNSLLDALLRYTTIGKTEDNFEEVSLVDIVDLAVLNLHVSVDETKAVIERNDLPRIRSIKSLIIQLFQNLVSNAIKFRKPDVNPHIKIFAEIKREEVIVCIKDNGIGIDPEFQERIFIIFQRLHKRSEYEGTGIGLAICQKIVQRLGGRIWVESNYGEGANFFVALPWNHEKN